MIGTNPGTQAAGTIKFIQKKIKHETTRYLVRDTSTRVFSRMLFLPQETEIICPATPGVGKTHQESRTQTREKVAGTDISPCVARKAAAVTRRPYTSWLALCENSKQYEQFEYTSHHAHSQNGRPSYETKYSYSCLM